MSVSPTTLVDAPSQPLWVFNDGGRRSSGFKGHTGDCVIRAIAIAAELDYREVYDELFERGRQRYASGLAGRPLTGKALTQKATPRTGVAHVVAGPYLRQLGWTYTPCIDGQHLRAADLPSGRLIVILKGHYVAVLDGVIHDTYESSRAGARLVEGYWRQP